MLGRYALGRHAIGRTPEDGSYAVNAEAGSFVWTGQDADLYSLILTAEAGSFAWTGQDAGGSVNINFECGAGSFIWTGMDADLYSLILTAEAGSFAWTGMDSDRAQTKGILRARGSATPFINLASSGGGRINMRGGRAC